jgi:hypothetical protein
MTRGEKIGFVVALFVVCALVIFGQYDMATGENRRVPLWGFSDGMDLIWHSDTNTSGDEIVHADDYHWDTLAMHGFARSDGVTSREISFRDVWQYDGFKIYLKIPATSAGCSTRVHFRIGTTDSIYATLHDSAVGAIEKIYNFFDYYDSDSMGFMDKFEIDLILGDTITNDTEEFDRTIHVRGALFGKD